ncbi:MAG: hypothetical protein C0410_08145 [Anaerolinea sp.]|nr:hypothetical protein [Anaerolinea sp.]
MKRHRFYFLILFLILALVSILLGIRFSQENIADPLSLEERAWLERHPGITLAPDPDFPPIESFDENGNYVGVMADVFREMQKNLQYKFTIAHLDSWNDVLIAAKNREIDGITAAQETPERSKYLLFSQMIVDIPNVIIVTKDLIGEFSFATLAGKKVAVTEGYAIHEFIQTNYPEIILVPVSNDLAALQDVSFKKVDAAVVNLAIASYLIEQNGITNLRVAGDSGKSNSLYIATRSDQPILNQIMQKGLASISEKTKKDILARWVKLGTQNFWESTQFWLLSASSLAVLALLIVASYIWTASLRRNVRIRTNELHVEIQQRKLVEEEIYRLNKDLETRINERTEKLENAVKELDAFAYSVSHDLQAPIRHIISYMDILLENTKDLLDEENKQYMINVSSSANRMSGMINDLLSYSRMGKTELSFKPLDLGGLVTEVISEFEQDLKGRNISWKISNLPIVNGDRGMLRIVLNNLISNALKFSGPRKLVEIEIGYLPGNGIEDVFFVRDNGVGFDNTQVDRLFSVFQRLHSSSEFEGSGIGLANVRQIIERHGGRTWAEGAIDKGATFYFTLEKP